MRLWFRQEGAKQQNDYADANRCVGDIKDQKGPPVAEMQVAEIDDEAKPYPVEDIAERPAEHHPERDLVAALVFMAAIPFHRLTGGAFVRASVLALEGVPSK